MTPTEKDLQRLAKIDQRYELLLQGVKLETLSGALGVNSDRAMFDAIIRDLLAPWTAVPVGDEVVLLHLKIDSENKSRGSFNTLWFRGGKATPFFNKATRFASPLAAAEALHQDTEKA